MPVLVLNGIAIPLLNAVANGIQNGATFSLPALPGVASWSTSFGSAPGSCTISIQVSNDGSVWTTIDTSTSTAGETRQLPSVIAVFVRAIISAEAGGSTTTVTFLYKGFSSKSATFGELLFTSMQQVPNTGAGLEIAHTYTVPANTLKNNGDTLFIESWYQLANNANVKLTAITITGSGTTVGGRSGIADANLPRAIRCRLTRTAVATNQGLGLCRTQGQGTLVTLSASADSWAAPVVFNSAIQGVAANDIIARGFQVWYRPIAGTYVSI